MSTLESFPPYSSTGINELLRRVRNALHRVTGRNDRRREYWEMWQFNLRRTLASINSARSSYPDPLVRRKKKGAGQNWTSVHQAARLLVGPARFGNRAGSV